MTIAIDRTAYPELERQLVEGAQATQPVTEIDLDQASALAPHVIFGPDHRAMWESHAYDIDVAATHQAFVRGFRAAGGEVFTTRALQSAVRTSDSWQIQTSAGELAADVVVNAAGAWGDAVARSAGMLPVGLQPLKRTAFMVTSPFADSASYAFVAEVHHNWYVRPDGTQFMCSPADEAPSEPCDARADEVDIARTIDMLNANTRLGIRSVQSHWAGLRTFSPDRSMVIGPDPDEPNFIWCVGQGGTGIQTSPGAGRLVADLVTTGAPSTHFAATGLALDALLPDRLR